MKNAALEGYLIAAIRLPSKYSSFTASLARTQIADRRSPDRERNSAHVIATQIHTFAGFATS